MISHHQCIPVNPYHTITELILQVTQAVINQYLSGLMADRHIFVVGLEKSDF